MKKPQIISMFLLTALLVSCGQTAGEDPVTTVSDSTVTEPVETEPEYIYPDEDFEGHEFVFLNQALCSWANRLCVPEETTGDLINDAMYERN